MDATPDAPTTALDDSVSRTRGHRPVHTSTDRGFFKVMSLISLTIAVVGFLPTFFVPLAQGTYARPPIFYVHGVLFFAWIVFFFLQAWHIRRGRILAHREWGVLGAALVAAMVFSVVTVNVYNLNHVPLGPDGLGWKPAALFDLATLVYLALFAVIGFARVREPEVHKRAMLLATLPLLRIPISHWTALPFTSLPPSAQPIWVPLLPIVSIAILIIAAMIYDRRTLGRVSKVYWIGLPTYLAFTIGVVPLAISPTWLHTSDWLKSFAG